MSRGILTDAERLAWERFPAEPDADVIGLTLADGEVDALRRLPTPAAALASAVALAGIRWLGFAPAELGDAPAAGVERLAGQLDVDAAALLGYAPAERTAREHRQRAGLLARFRDARGEDLDALEDLLVEHALEHDSPLALLRAAVNELRERQLLRPALSTLERLVASARARAERETFERLEAVLEPATRRALDALCVTDVRLGVSRLVWLGREAMSASPPRIVEQLSKLSFLRELGAESWVLEAVPANRRRQLAALARRSSTAALAGRPDRLRYPALLCFCHEQAVRLVDEVLDRSDQALGEAHGRARRELEHVKAETATAANEKVALFDLLVGLLLDDSIADDELRQRAWQAMPPARWAAAREHARQILRPVDDNHFEQLAARYAHLRRFVPALLAALRFHGVPPARPLLDALGLLGELNATGRRTLPDTAPADFVPARWRPHTIDADGKVDRRRWELCLLSELRTALRAGAVWVEGSRRYQPADRYLITATAWPARRDGARRLLGLPARADERLEQLAADLQERVVALDAALASGQVAVDTDGGELQVRRLPGSERSAPTTKLADEIAGRLPDVDLADVLIDVDAWTHFSEELLHAHGATPRQPRLREHRYAALLAHACNLGYARMGQAARIDPQQLAWTTQWYLRPEALAAANARIVNAHHALPLAHAWGSGRFSSSDGKRYPVGVQAPDAQRVARYFGRGRGITFYAWTSDHHTHYATRVVRTTVRDATYVLDGILDNQTELPIDKHTTDTAGYSDLVFALFDLLGLQFAPRLAGLPERRLYHPGRPLDTPAGRLLTHPLDLDRIRDGWDDLVRCAASLRDGTVTASLLVGRLQAAGVKLPLVRALQEYGRLVKTRFVLGYLADETAARDRPPAQQGREPPRAARPALPRPSRHRAPSHPRAPIHPGILPAPGR